MTDDHRPDAMQRVWQSLGEGKDVTTLKEVHAYAQRLQRRIAWRNGREYIAAVIVTAMLGQAIWNIPSTLIRIASLLIIAATAFVLYYLHAHGSVQPLPQELGAANGVDGAPCTAGPGVASGCDRRRTNGGDNGRRAPAESLRRRPHPGADRSSTVARSRLARDDDWRRCPCQHRTDS